MKKAKFTIVILLINFDYFFPSYLFYVCYVLEEFHRLQVFFQLFDQYFYITIFAWWK